MTAQNHKKIKILVIEDTLKYATNAQEAYSDYNVKIVDNLEEAIELIKKWEPNYLISDVYFPLKKGEAPQENFYRVLEIAKQYEKPLAFVTAAGHHNKVNIKESEIESIDIVAATQQGVFQLSDLVEEIDPKNHSYTTFALDGAKLIQAEENKNKEDRCIMIHYEQNPIWRLEENKGKTKEIWTKALYSLKELEQEEKNTEFYKALERAKEYGARKALESVKKKFRIFKSQIEHFYLK